MPGCTIWGTSRNDTLIGTAGADTICGLGGNDTINAGGGNNKVYGDLPPGARAFSITPSATFTASLTDLVPADNRAAATIAITPGLAGNDTIRGEAGNDVLIGQDGDDLIQGGRALT